MKAMKKNDGVSPVIAVILMVAITVVLAGVVFLWAQSFTDDADGDVETMNVKGSIDVNGVTEDGADDTAGNADDVAMSGLQIEVVSGTIDWTEYAVTIDGVTVYTVAQAPDWDAAGDITANSGSTSAGGSQWFSIFAYQATPLTSSTEYTVKIVNIGDNKVVWEDDIIATA